MANSKLQFTVEIDPRRIDYKMINSQISDKIEALTSEEIIELFFSDEMVTKAVEAVVKKCMGQWLVDNGYAQEYTNTKAVTKYVDDYCKAYVKDLCDEAFSEDVQSFVTEKIGELLPQILVDGIIQHFNRKIEDYTYNAIQQRYTEMVEGVKADLANKISM